jgi:hypothetical protein
MAGRNEAAPVCRKVDAALGDGEERRPLDDELARIGGLDGAGVELAAIVMEPPELHSALAHVVSFLGVWAWTELLLVTSS